MTQKLVPDKMISAEALFTYCERYATRAEKANKGTQWPTIRQIKRRFRCSRGHIEDAVSNYHGAGYMGIGVGVQVGGVGGGIGLTENENEHVVEAYL